MYHKMFHTLTRRSRAITAVNSWPGLGTLAQRYIFKDNKTTENMQQTHDDNVIIGQYGSA